MKVFVRIIALMLIFTIVLVAGCSDRGTNGVEDIALVEGGSLPFDHIFCAELLLQLKNDYQRLEMVAYRPKVNYATIYGGEARPVPLLILLPPKGKDEYFYFNHGLQQLADELIATGQIQPMMIATISNDLVFGGYFFAGKHAGAGNYDTLVGGTLIDHIDNWGQTLKDPAKRGIGGVGMGAYGAFRAALLNPGTFTSVSAIDGPLDFDGANGTGGFIPLFADALNEQGLLGGTTEPFTVDGIDTTWPPSWRENFDSLSTYEVSRLFIGGALAFSPHDTLVVTSSPNDAEIISRECIPDTLTLIPDVVRSDANNLDFHLPFDSLGNAYQPIWDNFWLPNNLENLLAGSNLDGVNMWIATSDEASFSYHEQTVSWLSTLQSEGLAHISYTYSGYEGNPATSDQYIYDLLKELLIFHSNSFGE